MFCGKGLRYFIHRLNLIAPVWLTVHFPHTGAVREVKCKHCKGRYGWNGM